MIKSYLLTVSTMDGGGVHGYLITNKQEHVQQASEKLIELCKENNFHALPLILVTELNDDDAKSVEDFFRKKYEEIDKNLNKHSDFHLFIISTPKGADNDWLVAWH